MIDALFMRARTDCSVFFVSSSMKLFLLYLIYSVMCINDSMICSFVSCACSKGIDSILRGICGTEEREKTGEKAAQEEAQKGE
jgi:hypothetical protein